MPGFGSFCPSYWISFEKTAFTRGNATIRSRPRPGKSGSTTAAAGPVRFRWLNSRERRPYGKGWIAGQSTRRRALVVACLQEGAGQMEGPQLGGGGPLGSVV